MYPPLIAEMLAAAHQRDLLDEAARERVAAALVGRTSPWWAPIASRVHTRHRSTGSTTPWHAGVESVRLLWRRARVADV